MAPSDNYRSTAASPNPVRKVKVREKSGRTVGIYSVGLALAAALVAFLAWRSWQGSPAMEGYVRRAEEVRLTWQCPSRHRFHEVGQIGPRACPVCTAPAYVVEVYLCPRHGRYEVLGEFGRGADPGGAPTMVRLKVAGGSWQPAETRPPCPICGQAMTWVRNDPVAELDAQRDKGG